MKARFSLAILLFSSVAAGSSDRIMTDPLSPASGEVIEVTVSGIWRDACVPQPPRVERDGNRINLVSAIPASVCLTVITPWTRTVEIGALEAGVWTLRMIAEEHDGDRSVIAQRSLVVRPAAGPFVVQPATAAKEGGTTVRITGQSIAPCSSIPCAAPTVRFGGVPALRVSILDANRIDAVAPPHAAGLVDVEVVPPGGSVIAFPKGFFYYDPAADPDPSVFERVLLPVMFEGPGAVGSLWTTEATIYNDATFGIEVVNVLPGSCPPADGGCPPEIPADATLRFQPADLGQWHQGYLLAVPREIAPELRYGLHIRDLTRQAEAFGTEIDVVRDWKTRSGRVVLVDIPTDGRFRRTLRVYDLLAEDGLQADLRVIRERDSRVLLQMRITLRTFGRCVTEPCWIPEPAAFVMPLDGPFPSDTRHDDRIRVEITPVVPLVPLWAFVSVTNNSSQHVTTSSPQ
ncbi:MAG TPA: IPT/TIG domain-containing protein [Thermoanaerobaculia bacterium]|nr:IPT/TIG domain-containing protein [Thermoanaerobaculia bacterium]